VVKVTRQYRFSASHRLHSHLLSEDANREVYGKCNNPYGHGHDYVVQVQVQGPVEEATGLAVDVNRLDEMVKGAFLDEMANRNLNDLEDFAELVPTTENLAVVIEQRLGRQWQRVFPKAWPKLDGVRVLETKRNIIETKGMR
jgi:6-pyruvoyltetrahydropterin/6-carboxytetrahydropterin synthase